MLKTTTGVCEVGGGADEDEDGGGAEEDGGKVEGDELESVEEVVVWIIVDGVLVRVDGGPDEVMMDVLGALGEDGTVTVQCQLLWAISVHASELTCRVRHVGKPT